MNSKAITVIPATGGPYRDLSIEPGTAARDIKAALGLSNDEVLTKGRGAEPIPDDENLYQTLTDGSKLYTTSPVEWGGGFFGWLLADTQPTASRVRVQRTYARPGRQSVPVLRNPRPYWLDRGWCRNDREYSGDYQVHAGRWPGRITQSPGGRVDTFINNPPGALKRHPHWPCFHKRDGGWFFIHPVRDAPDVSAAIIAVENTLTEAFNQN